MLSSRASGALFQVLESSSMKYMNALAPPFPPFRSKFGSKRLVLATLHVVLGVSANRPLALTAGRVDAHVSRTAHPPRRRQ
ncbi:hypothetical protein B0H14DRAFT_3526616 [Mycena olivaceomarginata]|nr:hypothetical protein B0H14DRAFT_3526616 [Mycena olivaceomarginata]